VITRAAPEHKALLLEMAAEFNAADGHPHDSVRIAQALATLLADDDRGVVYLIGDPIVGYAVITWGYSIESGGRDALLDEIFVRTSSEGIGGEALDEILADLQRRGIPRIFLETERANYRVRRFYARHGFVEEDSIWMGQWLLRT
jgi:ribosomal protein S18 acetylase RimI-like enzyme